MIDELPLLEREAETGVITRALRAAEGGTGSLVVIEGEAGIGKSRLVGFAVESAPAQGARALRARGSELEREYPYGLVLALLEPLVREPGALSTSLQGPAAAAAALFRPTEAGFSVADDPFATIHGLYWLVLDAAEHGPLLLAIDDIQWSDAASLRFLHYLAHRLVDLPITMIVTLRSTDHPAGDVAAQLGSIEGAIVLRPTPLSDAAVHDAARHMLGTDRIGRHRDAWRAARGNPFYLTEILRALRESTGTGPRVPRSVADFVAARIGRLERSSSAVAEAVAVLGEAATLRRVVSLTGSQDADVIRVVRELVGAAILDPGAALDFVHPIVRDAVYESIPAVARARAHRDAAVLLLEDGAPDGVVGAQLLEAERSGDPRVVASLLRAAESASRRGEHHVAAVLLRRAIEEPPAASQVTGVLVALGRAEAATGDAMAGRRLEEALARIGEPRLRAELLLELGHIQINAMDWSAATATFERGLRDLGIAPGGSVDDGGLDPDCRDVAERLEAGFVSAAWVTIERRPEAERAIARILEAPTLGSVNRSLVVWSAFQKGTVVSAPAAELADITLRVFAEAPIGSLISEGQIVEVGGGVLVATDELAREVDILTEAMEAAERAGLFGKVGLYAYCRAWPMLYMGRLSDAVADAQAALRVAELGWETFLPASRAVLCLALIERGELAAAADAADLDPAGWGHRVDYQLLVPIARGRLALARGDAGGALVHLEEASRAPAAAHFRALVPPDWRLWTVVTLAATGRRDEARALAAETLAIAHDSGARWTLGCALRVAGIAEGGQAGVELLRESVRTLDGSPAVLEIVRAGVTLGRALRQLGRVTEARDVLTRAMDRAHAIGALALLAESREELRAAGSRPRRYARTGLEALTPSELRVVRLAADGRTNREIAQALFVTPKAVEFHLANAFPKLGVASRGDLSRVLAESGRPPT